LKEDLIYETGMKSMLPTEKRNDTIFTMDRTETRKENLGFAHRQTENLFFFYTTMEFRKKRSRDPKAG